MTPNELVAMAAKERARLDAFACRVFCCAGTGCQASGCPAMRRALVEALASHGLAARVQVVPTGCMGLCSRGPLLRVEAAGQAPVLYTDVKPLVARLIVAEHILPLLVQPPGTAFALPDFLREHTLSLDLPFFTRQRKVVLAHAGCIDPESIGEYVAAGGYAGLVRALAMTPAEVIGEIRDAGLRGRGGGGYPTATKWANVRRFPGAEKFIVCNGDEGDPGAYMDRSILEGDPHAVIEGMAIAAHATGASTGWFYIRAEYPLAVERIEKAIRQARKAGLLGQGILGSGLAFDCEVRLGAGAFVCGEETALIASLEGCRGTPRPRPPYPSEAGLWNCPTCVNNVETLANVPAILRDGAVRFAELGFGTSRGTKVFALTGKAHHTGLIEVPMGISLREIVEEIAGGSATGLPIKAVQTGGPSGGVIPAHLLDTPVGYDELQALGSIMGSGGMIVMDEADSMVDIAAFYLEFTVDESCGKCAPCRIGGRQMLDLLRKIAAGEGASDDLKAVRLLAEAMQRASLCGLGQTAPNPVVSTLRHFESEYRARLRQEPP